MDNRTKLLSPYSLLRPPSKKTKASRKNEGEAVYCFVPNCPSNCIRFPDKLFLKVPQAKNVKMKWMNAVGLKSLPSPQSDLRCCEDHFALEHDARNWMMYKLMGSKLTLKRDVVPHIFDRHLGLTPDKLQVCMICLDTDSKKILLTKHNLHIAYEKLTGIPLCEGGNLKRKLCVQCAQGLRNFSKFRDKSLRACSMMMKILEEHEFLTIPRINMIKSKHEQLKYNLVSTTQGPDHCDLYVVEEITEIEQPQSEKSVNQVPVKTECKDDPQLADGDMEVVNEDHSDADSVKEEFTKDPLRDETAPFMCTFCREEFSDAHAYSAHVSMHMHGDAHAAAPSPQNIEQISNSETKDYETEEVCTTLETGNVLDTIKTQKSEPRYADWNEDRDRLKKSPTNTFACQFCQFTCKYKSVFTKHMMCHTTEKPFSCNICEYTSAEKSKLLKHMKRHYGVKPLSCELCNYRTAERSKLEQHKKTHIKPYTCTQCDFKCTFERILLCHIRSHTDEKALWCDQCDFKGKSNADLIRHVRTHTGEKPLLCTICGDKCGAKSALKVHMRTHTGEKPYSCDYCGFKSSAKSNLKIHIRRHTGEKPYECIFCELRCISKTTLTAHYRSHTCEKPIACVVCKYICRDQNSLISHVRAHSDKGVFACELCEYRSVNKRNLKKHVLTHKRKPTLLTRR